MRSNPTEIAGRLARGGRYLARALVELLYPETCVLCGAEAEEKDWCPSGPLVAGLGWSDAPHLCAECAQRLRPAPVTGRLPVVDVAVYAGCGTEATLVRLLGQWKYHGVRGLAWPLAGLMGAALSLACASGNRVDLLVPVPLHRRRRRSRGFNQSEVLARLAGPGMGMAVAGDILRRMRNTGQQARLQGTDRRQENLAGAFAAVPGHGRAVGLVDDLVTSGATCTAAATALRSAGWQVRWVAALGLARAVTGDGEHPAGTAPATAS